MGELHPYSSVESAQLPHLPLHLAIGMFDGVHLGHRAVIEAAVRSARQSGGLSGVLTFRPHPSAIFRPAQRTRLILDSAMQARVLDSLDVDAVITQPFTPEFARISAETFLPWLKERLPQLAGIYVGQNFRFGAGRRGDAALLVEEGRRMGISVFSAPPVNLDGEPVNSTRIRGFLESGEIARANQLLGYAYFAEGRIISGRRLGRTLGFPTLNLPWTPDLRPRFGVYAVQVRITSGFLPGIANYGVRPTVETTAAPQLETHVFGACPFDTGDLITVEWLRFIRSEMKFASLDELKSQIARDVEAARMPPITQ